jgi:GDPmannose 4,6-dehydratase
MNSSETLGYNFDPDGFQRETTPKTPNSPYGIAKLAGYHLNRIYKEGYGLNTCSGTIFNSESPRRGDNFVTKKITNWFAEYASNGFKEKLKLGNIFSQRDWTHALDTVKAIRLIMDSEQGDDYIVASGETHTIYDFLFRVYDWVDTLYGVKHPLDELYEMDSSLRRPVEVPYLKGCSEKITNELGWLPRISFDSLVLDMVNYKDYG